MKTSDIKTYAVLGLGMTGLSAARYLLRQGYAVYVMDTREQPPGLGDLLAEFPEVSYCTGQLDSQALMAADRIVISPGLPLSTPEVQSAVRAGVPVIGDIDLFLEQLSNEPRIIAITGSNGKSTVTELMGYMGRQAGLKTLVGGNIGIPVLEHAGELFDLVVLELSSFQLETISALHGHSAVVLNISEDHMDRYDSLQGYVDAKHRIFEGAAHIVQNLDDALSCPAESGCESSSFSIQNGQADFHLIQLPDGQNALSGAGAAPLPQSAIRIKGLHNLSNVMAAFALGRSVGLDDQLMIESAGSFPGLAHRCEWVRDLDGVIYINDSKGTNIGATVAALDGLAAPGGRNIILLAGGLGKGADFSLLRDKVVASCRAVILFGKDRKLIAEHLPEPLVSFADDLKSAIAAARAEAVAGDIVLLSPACASFDMFRGFEHRGDCFREIVEALV